jgi:dTDP-4-dehydrorhamnose 3,5-epimerase
MKIHPTDLQGVFLIETRIVEDERGEFMKIFNRAAFEEAGISPSFKESYYSTSHKDVIRGMHFQTPPHEHGKMVYVTKGAIRDIAVDVRKGSPTYGKYVVLELSEENRHAVYISPGFAHGFLCLVEGSSVSYLQTTMHSPKNDRGIHMDSFGYDWGVKNPITSQRDKGLPSLAEFDSPFLWKAE